MAIGPGTRAALETIEATLREEVAAGRARIEVHDDVTQWIEIEPSNPAACPIWVTAEAPPAISIGFGHNPIRPSLELWSDDHAENLGRLAELVEAVANGLYEQTVKTSARNRIRVHLRFRFAECDESYEDSTTATGAVEAGVSYVLRFARY